MKNKMNTKSVIILEMLDRDQSDESGFSFVKNLVVCKLQLQISCVV